MISRTSALVWRNLSDAYGERVAPGCGNAFESRPALIDLAPTIVAASDAPPP
jgi:hypothetical protein